MKSWVISVLPMAIISPSIFNIAGALVVKNRSEAFFSTASFRYGRILSMASGALAPQGLRIVCFLQLHLLHDLVLEQVGGRALRLELDAQAHLVLRIGIAQGFLVTDDVVLVKIIKELIERDHAL